MKEHKSNNFVTVTTFDHPLEAAIIRGRLEAEGIEFLLQDELTVQAIPFASNAIGGVRLKVRESDFQQTVEILKEGGYISDKDLQGTDSKVFSFLKSQTAKIPFLKKMRFELRIIIIVAVLTGAIASIFHFATMPSTEEYLLGNNWCVDNIYYNDKSYPPNTKQFLTISGGGFCQEKIDLKESGIILLPGFNSEKIYADWFLFGDSLEITKADTFDFVYNGYYKIQISESELRLESKTTTIFCSKERLHL